MAGEDGLLHPLDGHGRRGRAALEPGDVLFSTYGYDIGSHPQDAAVVMPIVLDGELCAYAVVSAHQIDIGAKDLYRTDTTDNFQEGRYSRA